MSESTVCAVKVRRPLVKAVVAVMLTADRPELARRAVEAFRAQTYPHCRMLIWDTGKPPKVYPEHRNRVLYYNAHDLGKKTIGELRNDANSFAMMAAQPANIDILIHWDDDDWSHSNRIAEQVALQQSSGADCVGYREMLFWRTPEILKGQFRKSDGEHSGVYSVPGEAWLYNNPNPGYALGTSLCYKRTVWEKKPFPATSYGEDLQFITGLKCVGRSSLIRGLMPIEYGPTTGEYMPAPMNAGPRMIARIHAGNTSTVYRPELMAAIERQGGEWKRSPEWDSYCRATMEEK